MTPFSFVLVLSSVTGGDRKVEVPADKINLDFVWGNKVMVGTVNANREYFEIGVKDIGAGRSRISRLAGTFADASCQGAAKLQRAICKTYQRQWRDQSLLGSC